MAGMNIINLCDDSSSSSSDLECLPLLERLTSISKPGKDQVFCKDLQRSTKHSLSDTDDPDSLSLDSLPCIESNFERISQESPKKQVINKQPCSTISAKEQKILEKEALKRLKNAEREKFMINRPGDCLKTVTALLDVSLLEMKGSDELLKIFETESIDYSLEKQPFKNCVTWKRVLIEDAELNGLEVQIKKKEVLEDHFIALIQSEEFVNLVHADLKQDFHETVPSPDSLGGFVKHLKLIFPGMSSTIIVFGMEQFYRKNKSKEKRDFKNMVGDASPTKRKRATKKGTLPHVTQIEVEEVTSKIQLLESVNFKCVESITEIGEIIYMTTKSLAGKYLRKNTDQDDDFDSYLLDGTFAVKVDKDGKGLIKVWEQQLMTFHQVGFDTAQAIVARYHSPIALLKAYEACSSETSAERLLENIEVRRGFGPLNTTRRVGPELSSKIYKFLTSMSGETSLYQ